MATSGMNFIRASRLLPGASFFALIITKPTTNATLKVEPNGDIGCSKNIQRVIFVNRNDGAMVA
ncbi:hypothetical protein GA0071314_1565 [Halomonas sp. HL-93]|nr:MAG: hypothetical protein HLUCCO06_04925 [Halomonas sp. HL-93]SBR48164.1 hypothetical protein GA0071314_1565 [Halomonas sp. HL-93]SNY95779.1 hypothetical protein SAMN04488142_0289 [Halomonas sp. hl-4]